MWQDRDSDGYAGTDDCNEDDKHINIGAVEVCNDVDDDCDMAVDEGNAAPTLYFLDRDGDGWPNLLAEVEACSPPDGGSIAQASVTLGDCNDDDPLIHPEAAEVCGDGVDQDCDVRADEGVGPFFSDSDGDGYGEAGSGGDCAQMLGDVVNSSDCNDQDASISPESQEDCTDAVDNDCDAKIDEGKSNWCLDSDDDGFGDCASVVVSCEPIPGHVSESQVQNDGIDCDDDNALVHPVALELCGDQVDSNCDGFDCKATVYSVESMAAGALLPTDAVIEGMSRSVDATGDGAVDLWISQPGHSLPRGDLVGRVSLFGEALSGTVQDDEYYATVLGSDEFGYLGRAFAVGDLNGDGLADLAATETETISGSQGEPGGIVKHVYVWDGPFEGRSGLAEHAALLDSPAAGKAYASKLEIGGDVNGDHVADLLVADPYDDEYGDFAGAVYVYFGGGFRGPGESTDPSLVIRSKVPRSRFGSSLHSEGDFNGDGVSDLVVGAIWDSGAACGAGMVYGFYGPITGDLTTDDADFVISGRPMPLGAFGHSFSSGDVDSDGSLDLAVGTGRVSFYCVDSESGEPADHPPGYVSVFRGPLFGSLTVEADAHLVIDGEMDGNFFGWQVVAGFDFDRDGHHDLIVSAPEDSEGSEEGGGVYLFYGPLASGQYSAKRAQAKLVSYRPFSHLGLALVGNIDLDRDGGLDLAVLTAGGATGADEQALYFIGGGARLGQ